MYTVALSHLAATLFMTGVIWFVQVVHYPSLQNAAADTFKEFSRRYQQNTSRVVGPAMLIEGVTALWLLAASPSPELKPWLLINLFCLLAIWVCTGALSMPLHAQLAKGFDAASARSLVSTNWPRTIFWTARSVLLLCLWGGWG